MTNRLKVRNGLNEAKLALLEVNHTAPTQRTASVVLNHAKSSIRDNPLFSLLAVTTTGFFLARYLYIPRVLRQGTRFATQLAVWKLMNRLR